MAEDDFNSFKNNHRENDSDCEPHLPLRLDLVDDSHSFNLEDNRLENQSTGSFGKFEKLLSLVNLIPLKLFLLSNILIQKSFKTV